MGQPRTARGQKPQQNFHSPSVRTKRVGGGFITLVDRSDLGDSSHLKDTLEATYETLNVLPGPTGPLSARDLSILEQILFYAAESALQDKQHHQGSDTIALVKVLQAYEAVLPCHGVAPQDDVFYYRILLKLSLDPNPDWWAKLRQHCSADSRVCNGDEMCARDTSLHQLSVTAAAAATHCTPKPLTSSAAATAASDRKGHTAAAAGSASRHRSASASSTRGRQAGIGSHVPAAPTLPAVKAAAAAVKTAATAVVAAWAKTQHANEAAGMNHNCNAHTLPLQEELQLLKSIHDADRSSSPLTRWQQQWEARTRSTSSTAACAPMHSSSCCGQPPVRAESISPVQSRLNLELSSCAAGFSNDADNGELICGLRQRAKSLSPCRLDMDSKISPGALWHTAGSSGFANDKTHINRSCSPVHAIGGVFPPLNAANSDLPSFWQRPASPSLSSPLGPLAASYLPHLELNQYKKFCQKMASIHSWRQLLLAEHAVANMQALAERRWRLAMSFWEVHTVWRCFKRWQRWAALAADDSSASYQHWLLLCSFQWWMSMVRHYRRQRMAPAAAAATAVAGPSVAAATALPAAVIARAVSPTHGHLSSRHLGQQPGSRPGSPLAGICRLLKQHPQLRPPASAAAAARQEPSGHVLAAVVFAAWLQLVNQRAEMAHVQSLLAWHHIQHIQAGALTKWRLGFEATNPHHRLMRVVYQTRRNSMLKNAVRHWQHWAPAKRAKRRHLRDAQAALHSKEKSRVWRVLKDYMTKRQAKNRGTQTAKRHFRRIHLQKHLAQWAHILEIQDAFNQVADSSWAEVLARQAARMLRWWRQWQQQKHQMHGLLYAACQHMEGYTASRCLSVWRWCVLRRAELEVLQEKAEMMSARAAGRAGLKAWRVVTALRKRHQHIMLQIITRVLRWQLRSAWSGWLAYVGRRRQQQQVLAELTQHSILCTCTKVLTAWQDKLQSKVKLAQAIDARQARIVHLCTRHWKAWVDQKIDWRAFEARVLQHMLRFRLAAALHKWLEVAVRNSMLTERLNGFLQQSRQHKLQQCFQQWASYLTAHVAKRMNQLSALLHWEQALVHKAFAIWLQRTTIWRWKRMQHVRADSYHALRLLDLALTGWTSVWVESQELQQTATFFLAGKRAELQVQLLRQWAGEAARLKLKRERLEIAGLHSVVCRQAQVLAAWRAEVQLRIHLRELLSSSIQRWSHLALSRGFGQWKSWALHKAGLHRRMKGMVSLLAGRTLQWAFFMLREHTLRKRQSRAARHFRQQLLVGMVIKAWKQQVSDARAFEEVVGNIGQQIRLGFIREVLTAWRDVVRLKHWKNASMMRALVLWGGNRKQLCFKTWRQWVVHKHGKQASLTRAMHHWHHLYLSQAFYAWQQYSQHMQVAYQVTTHFDRRRLQLAFAAWRSWNQRKTYLAARFTELQGRGHKQLQRLVLHAWRSFAPSSRTRRQIKGQAHSYWQQRLLAVCFFSWQDYTAYKNKQRQQLTTVLLHWGSRLLAITFRGWRQITELQLYRCHIIEVVGGRVNNGLLLKALNCWRDIADAKNAKRERVATAEHRWVRQTKAAVFQKWCEVAHHDSTLRQAEQHRQLHLLSCGWSGWHLVMVVRQHRRGIMRQLTGKSQQRLMWLAWTAWREVIDQRHQVARRLCCVQQHLSQAALQRAWDGWREQVLLAQLEHKAAEHWTAVCLARCLKSWRVVAATLRATTHKVAYRQSCIARRLASNILQEWAELAWLLPRERRAVALQGTWLLQRGLWAWAVYVQQQVWARQASAVAATRWADLHLTAGWNAWRRWMQHRQAKEQCMAVVFHRWTHLHQAAAFQAWYELVQEEVHHRTVHHTIAGRWRNLHAAAAFGAWRSYVQERQQHQAAHDNVARRWSNLHVAAAFSSWREAQLKAAASVAAAEAAAKQLERNLVSSLFAGWLALSQHSAELRTSALEVSSRRRSMLLVHALVAWQDAVGWRQHKQMAHIQWRQRLLSLVLQHWGAYAWRKAACMQTAEQLRSRTCQHLLHRSLFGWQRFTVCQQHKAEAAHYAACKLQQRVLQVWQATVYEQQREGIAANCAASKLQQRVLLTWLGLASETRSRSFVAMDMAARVMARVQNQLLYHCFSGWRDTSAHKIAIKKLLLQVSLRRMLGCFAAWHQYSHKVAGAAKLVRRLLASTQEGAFREWRAVAAEEAHWRRVAATLANVIQLSSASRVSLAQHAASRWLNWPLSIAFDTWHSTAADQIQECRDELRAATFLYYALTLKALTGFVGAVQEAKKCAAADHHLELVLKRSIFRAWVMAAEHLKERRHKLVAAVYTYSQRLVIKSLVAWLSYLQHKQHNQQQMAAARRHYVISKATACFRAWLQVVRYLGPLRRTLGHMLGKRHLNTLHEVFLVWQLHCHKQHLLRHALARVMHRLMAQAFGGWRQAVCNRIRWRQLLHVAVGRLSHCLLSCAMLRWFEAVQQLKQLRLKAHQVLSHMMHRRLWAAFQGWRQSAACLIAKRLQLSTAAKHWHSIYAARAFNTWRAFVQEARHHRQLSERMLQCHNNKQQRLQLQWWHLIAQDLHHHRVVLKSFRARHVRDEGTAVFEFWREWAQERVQERSAFVTYWNRLLVTAFGAWLQHHEDIQWDKAAAHDAASRTQHTITAWKVAMALTHRRMTLTATALQMRSSWCRQTAMAGWLRYTYYAHMGHVALQFRVRRLGCLMLRHWLLAAQELAQDKQNALELTHQLATTLAHGVLTDWQQLLTAQRHRRQSILQGCLQFWVHWAPHHRRKNARWREAAQRVQANKRERCFYSWRWYCQVRVMREVAFQHKQRAIREALAVGEQVARRKRAALLAASFMAWHVQVSKYRKVAEKLAGLLHRNLSSCLRAWRDASDQARIHWLRAERHAAENSLAKLLPAWLQLAQELRLEREAAETAADKHFRRIMCRKAIQGWLEELQVVREQLAALWKVILALLQLERHSVLTDAFNQWQQYAKQHIALRSSVIGFVNRRRLSCLSVYLTMWQQYTAAMRADGGAFIPTSPVTAAAAVQAAQAAALAAVEARQAATAIVAAGTVADSVIAVPIAAQQSFSPPRQQMGYSTPPAAAHTKLTVHTSQLPAGLLPVTGGPESPVLGARSAQQDRRLARRMAAMGGGAAEVDPGSDDEELLFAGLPPTEAALAATKRRQRQQPLLALSKGYQGRRVTLGDDKTDYNDAMEAAATGRRSPGWDLHSIADSMRQAHEYHLPPWQLPSVKSSPKPKPPRVTTLSLDELRLHQQLYPYRLQQQHGHGSGSDGDHQHWHLQLQAHAWRSLQQQRLGVLVGRPALAASHDEYRPLLQQQLMLPEQQLQQAQQRRGAQAGRLQGQHVGRQMQQLQQQDWDQHNLHAEPWHASPARSTHSHRRPHSTTHWPERHRDILGDDSSSNGSRGSSRNGTPSAVTTQAGLH